MIRKDNQRGSMCHRLHFDCLVGLGIALCVLTGCVVVNEPPCCGASATQTKTDNGSGDWRVSRIVETTTPSYRIIDVSTLHARNCTGPNTVTVKESLSKTTTHEITVGGNLGAEVTSLVTVALEARFEIKNGESFQQTIEHSVAAQPRTNIDYRYIWKEVWVDGYVILRDDGGAERQIPFSLRKSLQDEPLEQIDLGCK